MRVSDKFSAEEKRNLQKNLRKIFPHPQSNVCVIVYTTDRRECQNLFTRLNEENMSIPFKILGGLPGFEDPKYLYYIVGNAVGSDIHDKFFYYSLDRDGCIYSVLDL